MTDYANFRQRLDAVLRTLNVKRVQDFLIAEKQWRPGQPIDPEYAMWMMIAGSQTLRDLHEQARQWLVSHGHEEEANAVLGRDRGGSGKQAKRGERHEGESRSSKGRASNSQKKRS